MPTAPFGAAGFGFPAFDASQWEQISRPWVDAFASAPKPAPFDPFAWMKPPAPPQALDPSALASQWMSQIQQLAAQFAGREAPAADIARAWRSMLGENPFASGLAGAAFMPLPLMGGGRGPFEMPGFGFTREHQERMQGVARAGVELQQAAQAFQAIVAEAGQDAFARFESLLAKRGADGNAVESSRALFDLWIDAAEDAYADVALSERFQRAFGDYVNAQMRARAAMQKEVELASAQWGIPGRAEVDAAHKRAVELEREVRRLRDRVEALERASDKTMHEPAPAKAPARKGKAK